MPRPSGKHVALMMVFVAAGTLAATGLRVARGGAPEDRPRDAAGELKAALERATGEERPAGAVLLGGALRTDPRAPHSFYFTRLAYSGGGWRGRSGWATDYPKADRQFLVVFRRLVGIDSYPDEHAMAADDPNIRRFPFLYALEVGSMGLTEPEVKNLREYLLAGGFLMIDDFWGTSEWANFEYEIRRILPEYEIVDLPMDHEVFNTFYEIKELMQVPSINNICDWGRTYENDGFVPYAKGILDAKGRVMVAINWNTDIGDAWEWAEQPCYPLKISTFAYQMGVNYIVYAMSH